jgi:magnesium-transporting ATPase (P-type)
MTEGAKEIADRRWHAIDSTEVLEALGIDADTGLSGGEVEERRARYGANVLTPPSRHTALKRLFSQINNLFIYLLLAAAVVTAVLGEWLDSGVILGVVVIIVIIGFVQEGQAERALEAVRGMLAPKARVMRDGRARQIPADEIVVGDVVLLQAGDRVPVDVRLIKTKNLQTQEAALTGESTAVEKDPAPVAEDAELGDRANMAFSATLVTSGAATGIAVAVGDRSEIGRISQMISEVQSLKTPLNRRLDAFTKALSVAILALAAITFAVGVLAWDSAPADMFFAAVAIAVAAIPEGLPAVMTVTLALGVKRMASRNAIIRRLPAVETLGSVTIICSDKTGTLTKNEMTAKTVRTRDQDLEAEGVGYEPKGDLLLSGEGVDLADHPVAMELVRAGMLCSDASLSHEGDAWTPEGDPTEAALVVLAHKAGLDQEQGQEAWRRLDTIPFSSERRYMATLHREGDEGRVMYLKGAPERVLEMCSRERRGDEEVEVDEEAWRARVDEIAARGQRVLALARKAFDAGKDELGEEEAERELTLLGLFGLIDPPREEAIEAVAVCQDAGIRVKMVTGDHKLTAQAIAGQLRLRNPDDSLTGRDLEEMSDEELRESALAIDVFARTSPEQKLRLVTALQAQGEVTAMTGDGVNDAPALKRADIGIAMGQKGTDAAREASAMVLADDNFASIERAIEEGRTVYDNLKKAIAFILPTSAAEAFVIVIAILFGMELPITPVQVLWVNMITAATLGMALAWEATEGDVMRRPPRPTDEPLLTPFMVWRIAFVGVLLMLGSGLLFLEQRAHSETSLEYARTVAVNALVMGEILYLLNARFMHAPALNRDGLFGSREVWIAILVCLVLQVLFTHARFMNVLFGTEPLDLAAWMKSVAVGVAVFVAVELEKLVARTRLASAGKGRA